MHVAFPSERVTPRSFALWLPLTSASALLWPGAPLLLPRASVVDSRRGSLGPVADSGAPPHEIPRQSGRVRASTQHLRLCPITSPARVPPLGWRHQSGRPL